MTKVPIRMELPYRGNLRGRKLSRFGRNKIFTEKTFADCSLVSPPKDATPLNFGEKTFANSYKTSKIAEVFSLDSFSLYGNLLYIAASDILHLHVQSMREPHL